MERTRLIRLATAASVVVLATVLFAVNRGFKPPSSMPVVVPDGERIKVEVLNATPVRGLARRATFALRDAGFDVVSYGNDATHRDSTLVLVRSGNAEWGVRIARVLGGARVEQRPDSSRYLDITVLLGSDWRPPTKPFNP